MVMWSSALGSAHVFSLVLCVCRDVGKSLHQETRNVHSPFLVSWFLSPLSRSWCFYVRALVYFLNPPFEPEEAFCYRVVKVRTDDDFTAGACSKCDSCLWEVNDFVDSGINSHSVLIKLENWWAQLKEAPPRRGAWSCGHCVSLTPHAGPCRCCWLCCPAAEVHECEPSFLLTAVPRLHSGSPPPPPPHRVRLSLFFFWMDLLFIVPSDLCLLSHKDKSRPNRSSTLPLVWGSERTLLHWATRAHQWLLWWDGETSALLLHWSPERPAGHVCVCVFVWIRTRPAIHSPLT